MLASILLLAGAASCSKPRGSSAPRPSIPDDPITLTTPTTTAPSIALSNLEGEIADREAKARGGDARVDVELVPRYLTRAQFEGRVSDLAAALDASARAIAKLPNDARAHATRSSALAAVHEFTEADRELDAAAALGADQEEVRRARGAILLATGKLDEANALLPAPKGAPVAAFVVRGSLLSQLGDARGGEDLFGAARAAYRDVSPFAVAWMDFERGRALLRAGARTKARAYLAEAAEVLPTYAHAVVHVAALEPPAEALPKLDALVKTSDDPDVLASRADALRRLGRADEARAEADRARARFDELLAALPKAFLDHAATFYLGMGGDPPRALALAKANAENRATEEAVELYLTAAQAAGSREATCAAATMARALAHVSPELRARAESACP